MSKPIILVAGCGFAGVWAVLAAARAIAQQGRADEIDLAMVAPDARLVMRPRLYEAALESTDINPDVSALLAAVGARHIAGRVDNIGVENNMALITHNDGRHEAIRWDRFVLATGSQLAMPPVPGLSEHAFDVDQLDGAHRLAAHIRALAERPESDARNTVVIVGGGFTGLEAAAEMPGRMKSVLGEHAAIRTVIVDPAVTIGADMGEAAAKVVRGALDDLAVERRAGVRVTAIDGAGVTLSDGARIASQTVVWTAGVRAHPLTAQLPGAHDALGRVIGDAFLHAPAAPGVFVAGDTVKAATDDMGNFNLMTCQHALSLGRVAGYNAAAELLGLPLHPYSQPKYVTCLDLGAWGALYTEGWDRTVHLTGAAAKELKQQINGIWIYPPAADREAAFAVSNPDFVIVP